MAQTLFVILGALAFALTWAAFTAVVLDTLNNLEDQ